MGLLPTKDNSGNVKTFWYLNGKTLWDYRDEDKSAGFDTTSPEPQVADVKPVEPVAVKAEKTIEERVTALEEWKSTLTKEDDDKVPF